MCVSAIKKFLEANLGDAKVVDHPALRTLVKGVHNLPHSRKYNRYRLVTCQEALKLTGHIVYQLPESKYSKADKEAIRYERSQSQLLSNCLLREAKL